MVTSGRIVKFTYDGGFPAQHRACGARFPLCSHGGACEPKGEPEHLLAVLHRFGPSNDFEYLRGDSVLAHTASEAAEFSRLSLDVIPRGLHHAKACCVLTRKRLH